MTKMPAAIATGLGKWNCEEINVPSVESGKVLVKTNLASICGSDLHITYMGSVSYTHLTLPTNREV